MQGTIKLVKCQNASTNAVNAFRSGKYFACQMVPVDRAGNKIPKNTRIGKEIWAQFSADLEAAVVKSDDLRSLNGREWHHIDRSSRGYMVYVAALAAAGWEITGNPNKELVY